MVNIIFEDTFEGFVSALFYAFKNDIKNPFFSKAKKPSLFGNIEIKTQKDIIKEAKSILDEDTMELFYDSFCYDEEKAYSNIYKSFLFYIDNKHLKDITKDFIRNIYYYRKAVGRERHKYSGFLRFYEVDDALYARFEPKHYVLDYLGYFFKSRYKNQKFIIHDTKRKKAFIYDKKHYFIELFDKDIPINQDKYTNLWKIFFETVSIKERENTKLQNQWIPKHYRKFMLEFS